MLPSEKDKKEFADGFWSMKERLADKHHRAWRYIPRIQAGLLVDREQLQSVVIRCDGGAAALHTPHVNRLLTRAWNELRAIWSSPHRSPAFISGLLAAFVEGINGIPQLSQFGDSTSNEETSKMSETRTFHNVASGVSTHSGTRLYGQFDPEFFQVKDGDFAVIETTGGVFHVVKVDQVHACTNMIPSSVGTVAARIDIEQLTARKEQAAKREQARCILREAAKRNSEMDLYEQVKAKLTAEEDALVKEALGYGTKTEAGAG